MNLPSQDEWDERLEDMDSEDDDGSDEESLELPVSDTPTPEGLNDEIYQRIYHAELTVRQMVRLMEAVTTNSGMDFTDAIIRKLGGAVQTPEILAVAQNLYLNRFTQEQRAVYDRLGNHSDPSNLSQRLDVECEIMTREAGGLGGSDS